MSTRGNNNKVTILFLCTGNSCRSQMAEGWARACRSDKVEAYSAGIEKHGMNPIAVKVMSEEDIDISQQQSNVIDELPIQKFDWVITLCGHADETCPFFPGKRVHYGFDDPPTLAKECKSEEKVLGHYRRVRDEIKDFVMSLPENLYR